MIKVNSDVCIGCGLCYSTMPDVFSGNDEGLAVANNEAYNDSMKDSLDEVIAACPTSAISYE